MARILSFFAIFFTSVAIAYFMYFRPEEDLPIYQPSDLNPALVDASAMREEDHRVLDFELINHLGDSVSLEDVAGDILVVDFFFTRCATICPLMTQNLKRVHDRLDPQMPVRILSHSVTPQADSVSVLNRYAEKHGANPALWWFLTGRRRKCIGSQGSRTSRVWTKETGGSKTLCTPKTLSLWMPKGDLEGSTTAPTRRRCLSYSTT